MKKIILVCVICFMAVACDEQGNIDKEKYLEAYREILIARETIADSLEANEEVQRILEKYKYTMKSFADDAMKLTKGDGEFLNIIDSLRKEFRAKY